jgi:acylphosphatase
MKHLKIRITGRVQAVFFRAFTQKEARRNKVRGFVRNERDGSVYTEAEGEEEQLRAFLDALRQGSPGSRVDEVSTTEAPLEGFSAFEVRH